MDLEIVKSALPMDLIESHDTMLFQLSKCDAVHAAIETISLKWMKESHANWTMLRLFCMDSSADYRKARFVFAATFRLVSGIKYAASAKGDT